MARKLHVQKLETVPVITTGPCQLVSLPKGFSGYVRVKFLGAAAGDFMFGIWVPISPEGRAQSMNLLSATNYAVHWADTNEKLWEFPSDEHSLIVYGSAANGSAVVDVAGEVAE